MKYRVKELKDCVIFDEVFDTVQEAEQFVEDCKRIDGIESFDCEYEIIEEK